MASRWMTPAFAGLSWLCLTAGAAEWHTETGARWRGLSPSGKEQQGGFTLLPPERTGIGFTNTLDEAASAANRILLNGAGLATGDFDHDELPDIYFCSLSGQSALYRNLGGWKFQEVTQSAGVALPGKITRGAVFADINGDGALDLLVSTLADGVIAFLNDGNGKFKDVTAACGTGGRPGSVTMALADVDSNGTLDLYVANYRSEDIRDKGQVDLWMVKGQLTVPPKLKNRLLVVGSEVIEFGEPDQLYLNDGKGHFTPVPWTEGAFLDEDGTKLTAPPLDWGLTASFRDLNGDGTPDLYVCNDYWTPDRIWLNDGKGHFRALPRLALRETSSSSMGVDFADLDQDGHPDFIVTDMLSRDPRLRKRQMPARWPIRENPQQIDARTQIIQNTLLHNRGDNTFEEIANFSGVAASDWTWQPLFLDIDLDGYPDLLVSAGHSRDVQDMDAERAIRARQRSFKGMTNAVERQKAFTAELMAHMRLYPRLEMPIFAFRNTGHLQFTEATTHWGTGQLGVHHCMALADFDSDGALDLVVNNLGNAPSVYRNNSSAPRVAVRLKGLAPNTEGIGAELVLTRGAVPRQYAEMKSGGSYMSGSVPEVVFAAGTATSGMGLEVKWRSGRVSRIADVRSNRLYEVDEQAATAAGPAPAAAGSKPLFDDVSSRLNYAHVDQPFDDLARQPLLPRKLSQLGPGVAWFDLDGDGSDDLIVGSGHGGTMGVFLNDGKGGFKPDASFKLPLTRDQTAMLGMIMADGQRRVLAGSANYEDGLAVGPAARQYDWSSKRIDDTLPAQPSTTGPMALADIDNDGDLDLFIGGRCLPGRYPEPASSLILRQNASRWELDSANNAALRNLGLVSGAIWTDLDGDGWLELVVTCEWGPVKIFQNDRGKLRPAASGRSLEKLTGWWTGLAAVDLDEDGRLDLVVGNWGLNSIYQATSEHPLRLYYGDIANRGAVDVIEAEWDGNQFSPTRQLNALMMSLPFVAERFQTVKAYSEASIAAVLGPLASSAKYLETAVLASMMFLNRGDRFEPRALPVEAQWAPVFAVAAADFDGDGHEDVFLSQNFFENVGETPRQAAGRGLLLLGDGAGTLRPVSAAQSGIAIYGEQRGAAVADFDKDGRADLVVAQNSAETKLLHNRQGKPGLRVRLTGPAGNPTAVGASLRLLSGTNAGPVREIHSGSGYCSQDSAVTVVSQPEAGSRLWIRWPGGKTNSVALPNSGEVSVRAEGAR